jgi:NTE family protein
VALALGGGGARGFAEIGVLRVLEQEKIPIHLVVGTSVGSLVGALYADSGRVLDAEFHALAVQEEDLFDVRALAIFSGGLVRGERLRKFVSAHVKARNIEDMAVPYAAVATDLRTGSAVVFSRGPVPEAVHASCAIPGVFVPVQVGEVTLVDGGVVEPVPVAVARRLGADVVIAVAIPAAIPPTAPRSPLGIAYHAVTIMAAEIGRLKARDAEVVIEPRVGDVAYNDFSQKKRLIEAGEDAARAALPAIRAALAQRRAPAS